MHRRFLEGEPISIGEVASIVRSIVRHRGWFVAPDDRPDVVQETLLDVLRRASEGRFRTDEDFASFVRVIAHRRCIDWVRTRRIRANVLLDGRALSAPDDDLLARERRELGCAVVARLRPECRDIFARHAGMGMTYSEIAEGLGRTEGAVRTQAYECLKQARRLLDRMLGTRRRG